MDYLILTHGGCMDGVCAAMIARKWAREVRQAAEHEIEVVQCDYGVPFDVERGRGKTVVVTDFKLTDDEMRRLDELAEDFWWLDHHASNQALADEMRKWRGGNGDIEMPVVVFDLERSGAGIAWDTFFSEQPRPWFVNYVEDRDLWRWALPDSREVSFFTQAQPKTLGAHERCLSLTLREAVEAGRAMAQYVETWVRDVCSCARRTTFEGLADVPIVTMTYNGSSDILNELVKSSPSGVAMGWFQRGDGLFQTSLRSDGRVDVSLLAKKWGGGGHPKAAAFQGPTLFPWERGAGVDEAAAIHKPGCVHADAGRER